MPPLLPPNPASAGQPATASRMIRGCPRRRKRPVADGDDAQAEQKLRALREQLKSGMTLRLSLDRLQGPHVVLSAVHDAVALDLVNNHRTGLDLVAAAIDDLFPSAYGQ